MAHNTLSAGADLLNEVERLAGEGRNKREIAQHLGMKTVYTLDNRLVKASQTTGKPIPRLAPASRQRTKPVETVEVRRRGKGSAFGLNVPQEPLARIGAEPGTRLAVKVKKGRIVLSLEPAESPAQDAMSDRQPRLIKRR